MVSATCRVRHPLREASIPMLRIKKRDTGRSYQLSSITGLLLAGRGGDARKEKSPQFRDAADGNDAFASRGFPNLREDSSFRIIL